MAGVKKRSATAKRSGVKRPAATRSQRNAQWIEAHCVIPEGKFVGKPLVLSADEAVAIAVGRAAGVGVNSVINSLWTTSVDNPGWRTVHPAIMNQLFYFSRCAPARGALAWL